MNPKLRTFLVWLAIFLGICALGLTGVAGTVFDPDLFSDLRPLLMVLLALVAVVLGLAWWGRRVQKQGAVGNAAEFRKNRARLLLPNAEKTRFSDVGGAAEAKQALADAAAWLRDPRRWDEAGVRAPRGILLEGPPGNGKTLLARAVAGEAGVRFIVASATDFVELFVGIGPARVRDLFETAVKSSPCVVFIDELDAVGRRRGAGVGLNNDEREHTLNQLLLQLDGFDRQGRFVVLAATNRADVLDPALLRPGRFDVRIRVGEPTEADRVEILGVHARGRKLDGVDLAALAAVTAGWSGASLERLVNEATLRALRRTPTGPVLVRPVDFDDALAAENRAARHQSPLDLVLIESMSQVAEPSGPARGVFTLANGTSVAGSVLWATPELIKLAVDGEAEPRAISRAQVVSVILAPAPALGAAILAATTNAASSPDAVPAPNDESLTMEPETLP